MTRTHKEIMDQLKPIEADNPERFKLFYDTVYLMLISINPGQHIVIADVCTERSKDLFLLIVELCMIEECITNPFGSFLEFSEGNTIIRRI